MDVLVTDKLLNLLMIATTLSIVVMAVIQKFKSYKIVSKNWHIFILNILFSFTLGILFSEEFYNLNLSDSIWVAIFSFIGAPSIYQLLKKQNIINYTPKTLPDNSNVIEVPKENMIVRN